MNRYIIGVDPDSKAHGVAIYINGKLEDLTTMPLVDIIDYILQYRRGEVMGFDHSILFSIEDVMANQFIYARNVKESKAAQAKQAMHVGRCQQSFVELIRVLDHMEIKYVTHKPQKGNWAETENKKQFEMATGWKKRSNEDTRSAAFFGFLACK